MTQSPEDGFDVQILQGFDVQILQGFDVQILQKADFTMTTISIVL